MPYRRSYRRSCTQECGPFAEGDDSHHIEAEPSLALWAHRSKDLIYFSKQLENAMLKPARPSKNHSTVESLISTTASAMLTTDRQLVAGSSWTRRCHFQADWRRNFQVDIHHGRPVQGPWLFRTYCSHPSRLLGRTRYRLSDPCSTSNG